VYSWQDVVVWLVVAGAVAYLWRTLGPTPRGKTTQVIRLSSIKRDQPPH
jgi:hypothetical protein